MGELAVSATMIRSPITVRHDTVFKDIVCALLAGEICAVPVVDAAARPLGTVTETTVLANLEFHGGTDPAPILGGASARKRWHLAAGLTAEELMAGPPAVVGADARISQAAHRLANSSQPLLCVVDDRMRLVGVLTARELLKVYQRSDQSIEADVQAVLAAHLDRPSRAAATMTVHVSHGVVTLDGTLMFRSRAEHAGHAAARVAGVVAVHNNLGYEVDDLAITGF